jgi:hypothetical protein
MTNEEQKLREFISKYVNDDNEPTFLSDLTALISEGYYPKEFVMWLSYNSSHYVIKTQNRWWSNSQDKYMTLDELYDYWKENEQ